MSKSKCKKVYYARCISDYNKEFDNYCINQLTNLGFEVVDPNIFFDKDEYEDKGINCKVFSKQERQKLKEALESIDDMLDNVTEEWYNTIKPTLLDEEPEKIEVTL